MPPLKYFKMCNGGRYTPRQGWTTPNNFKLHEHKYYTYRSKEMAHDIRVNMNTIDTQGPCGARGGGGKGL
jgi:hypothetical protein